MLHSSTTYKKNVQKDSPKICTLLLIVLNMDTFEAFIKFGMRAFDPYPFLLTSLSHTEVFLICHK